MHLLERFKQKKRPLIEKQELDATLRSVTAVLSPITAALILLIVVAVALTGILSAVDWVPEGGLWKWLPRDLPDTLNKWGGVIQGTIGVAATIAGAVVTVYIANLALEIARNTVDISKGEQRREAERYAREIKIELLGFGRELGRSFRDLEAVLCDATAPLARDLYLARLLIRHDMLVQYGGSSQDLYGLESSPGHFDEEARQVAALFRDAAARVGTRIDGVWYPDPQGSESHAGHAARIEKAAGLRATPALSFSDAAGVGPWIESARLKTRDAIARLADVLSGIESKGFVSDLVYGDKAAGEALDWLSARTHALLKILEDKDAYLERLGRAEVIAEMSMQNGSFGASDDRVGIMETLRLSLLCSFFSQSPAATSFDAYQDTLGVSKANGHFSSLFETLAADKEKVSGLFSLDIGGDTSCIPLSLRHYKPPEVLAELVAALGAIRPLQRENEKSRKEDAALDSDNPVLRFEQALRYWHALATRRIYGEAAGGH